MTASQKEPLTRLTVNLIPRANRSLILATEITGDSKTDTVNRALQVYAYLEHVASRGGEILIREDGEVAKVLLSYPGRNVGPLDRDALAFLDQEQDPASR